MSPCVTEKINHGNCIFIIPNNGGRDTTDTGDIPVPVSSLKNQESSDAESSVTYCAASAYIFFHSF